jgi:hypothetical protein
MPRTRKCPECGRVTWRLRLAKSHKELLVDADNIAAGDVMFDASIHVMHAATCRGSAAETQLAMPDVKVRP